MLAFQHSGMYAQICFHVNKKIAITSVGLISNIVIVIKCLSKVQNTEMHAKKKKKFKMSGYVQQGNLLYNHVATLALQTKYPVS